MLTLRSSIVSGAGSPHCKLYIVMGKTDPNNSNAHKQQSIMLVPSNAKGITIKRMMSVYGYDDAPHGHGHLVFKDVRIPVSSIVLGEGRGFEIMQGRLGPGRIHHAMRGIGAVSLFTDLSYIKTNNLQAEVALEWMLSRANDPRKMPFGKLLSEHGTIIEGIARSRCEIDGARLLVLNAAHTIDEADAKAAAAEIAEIKIVVPAVALQVIDRAVQSFGGEGISQNTPLAMMWAHTRVLRLADGPDEVHLQQLGKKENKRGKDLLKKLQWQSDRADQLFLKYGKKDTSRTARL